MSDGGGNPYHDKEGKFTFAPSGQGADHGKPVEHQASSVNGADIHSAIDQSLPAPASESWKNKVVGEVSPDEYQRLLQHAIKSNKDNLHSGWTKSELDHWHGS